MSEPELQDHEPRPDGERGYRATTYNEPRQLIVHRRIFPNACELAHRAWMRQAAWRAGAVVLAISAAALAPQITVIAAAGYVVFVLASDVRRRRKERAT